MKSRAEQAAEFVEALKQMQKTERNDLILNTVGTELTEFLVDFSKSMMQHSPGALSHAVLIGYLIAKREETQLPASLFGVTHIARA